MLFLKIQSACRFFSDWKRRKMFSGSCAEIKRWNKKLHHETVSPQNLFSLTCWCSQHHRLRFQSASFKVKVRPLFFFFPDMDEITRFFFSETSDFLKSIYLFLYYSKLRLNNRKFCHHQTFDKPLPSFFSASTTISCLQSSQLVPKRSSSGFSFTSLAPDSF